jgi:hypothetical protein
MRTATGTKVLSAADKARRQGWMRPDIDLNSTGNSVLSRPGSPVSFTVCCSVYFDFE